MSSLPEPMTGADRYGKRIDLNWLDGETIISAEWEDNPNLGITDTVIEGNLVTAFFVKRDVTGIIGANVIIETETARKKKFTLMLNVRDSQ